MEKREGALYAKIERTRSRVREQNLILRRAHDIYLRLSISRIYIYIDNDKLIRR